MSSFQDLGGFRSQTPRQKPKGVMRMLSLGLVIQRGIRLTSLSLCLRVIVNEKPLNLEKTTSICIAIILYAINILPSVKDLHSVSLDSPGLLD